MNYLILATIGIMMGLCGGFLGIGGSVVMIPAMVLAFGLGKDGENQHLYQASAMICNFFVSVPAVLVHRKARVLVADVIKWLIPVGILGILVGVWFSNIDFFAGTNSSNLTKAFGLFMIYVAVYNIFKFGKPDGGEDGLELSQTKKSTPMTILSGLLTGFSAGLLGLGGGSVCTPMQQLFLKMPLKRAISNSSALITATALFGAFYKNITLGTHGIEVVDSVRIAVIVAPTAILGSLIGSRLMHKLPKDIVRLIFVGLLTLAAIKMLIV